MRTSAWARSGRAPARSARAAGSWAASLARARAAFDVLTVGVAEGEGYSDVAAAAILSTALGLWSDTAAALDGDGLDETANMGTD